MNTKIKDRIRAEGIKQWQLAEAVGISERTLIVWLRSELTPERATRIEAALERLKEGSSHA